MSDTASVSNFYVDGAGKECPIRYKAAELVNQSAPDGYVWRKGNVKWDWMDVMAKANPNGFVISGHMWPKEDHEYDYYYAAKKETI